MPNPMWPMVVKCDNCDRRVGGARAVLTKRTGVYCADRPACLAEARLAPPVLVWPTHPDGSPHALGEEH